MPRKPKLTVVVEKVKRRRGRPPNAPKSAAPAPTLQQSATAGHNSERRRAQFVREIVNLEKLIADKDSVVAEIRNQRKEMKGLGFSRHEIDFALYVRKSPEEKVRAMFEDHTRVLHYFSHPVGRQFEMFEDRTPAVDVARELGKADGLEGKPCKPPYDAASEQGRAYIEGFYAAQEVLAQGIKQKPEDDVRPRFMQDSSDTGPMTA